VSIELSIIIILAVTVQTVRKKVLEKVKNSPPEGSLAKATHHKIR
jgi:hypothetical protein